jgi:GTP1/Obg family GTP-binding protein
MPGLQGRFSTLVKAKVSSALDRAEDPAETLDYSYEKQMEMLQQVKSGIVDVVTAKKRTQTQEESLRAQAAKLDGQASPRATRISHGRRCSASRRSRMSSAHSTSRSQTSSTSRIS